jgi:hypothetical protein
MPLFDLQSMIYTNTGTSFFQYCRKRTALETEQNDKGSGWRFSARRAQQKLTSHRLWFKYHL